jgi:hypothetical protein
METMDPQIVQAVSIGVAAAAMIVLGQSKSLLKTRPVERCASCSRLLGAGRRCPKCG